MEGRVVAAIGGCAVLAGVAYILQGGNRPGPNRRDQSGALVPGLLNLGNTCYLNSVLQALASLSVFVSWINVLREEKVPTVESNPQKCWQLTTELSKFLQILSKPCYEQDSYNPTPVFQSLYSHGWVISLEQQDAHEIFQVITSTLADEQELPSQKTWNSVLDDKQTTTIQDESIVHRSGVTASKVQRKSWSPFVGLFANQLSCKACSTKYPVKFESFDTISLSLSSNVQLPSYSLEGLIRHFMCSEVLESFDCSGCSTRNGESQKKRLLKKLSIGKLPQCLCIHISRTYWQDNGVPYKNNTFVRFSETLNIEPYLYTPSNVTTEIPGMFRNLDSPSPSKDSTTLTPTVEQGTDSKTTASQTRLTLNTVYKLVAVIVHLGGVENGHYVTYRRTEWPQGNEKWTLVSDEMTRTVPISHVLKTNAYMLFYERTTQ